MKGRAYSIQVRGNLEVREASGQVRVRARAPLHFKGHPLGHQVLHASQIDTYE